MFAANESQFWPGETARQLLESLGEAVIATDREGSVVFWNSAATALYGYSPAEVLGKSIYDLTVPEIAETQAHEIMLTLARGESWRGEFNVRDRQGRTFLAEVTDVPVLDDQGEFQMVIGVSRDVTARKQADQERERLIADLEAASLAKDDFLTMVSHELRTPLTTILGMSRVLVSHGHVLDEQSTRVGLSDIADAAHRMTRLIEDLLTLAHLSSNTFLDLEPLMVGRLVHDVVQEHQRYFPLRVVTTTCTEARDPVLGNRILCHHVLLNLLSNAEKYSPKDADISVSCIESDVEVVVEVMDRGIGISEIDLPHVFENFYRAPAARHLPGAGLGLAVSRRLVDLQGGRIWLERRQGGGTIARLALPKATEQH